MKVIDLFSGVGGLSLGFRQAGFSVAFAVEHDKEIADAYSRNDSSAVMFNEDITKLNPRQLVKRFGHVDVIVGGPPCQGFSQKGKRLSFNDDRNFLFKQYVRFVAEFRPKYFVLENVPNIITTANGYFKDEIIREFSKLGYEVKADVFDVADYGVPQHRRRAIFLGQQKHLSVQFPSPVKYRVTVKEALSDLPRLVSGEAYVDGVYTMKPQSDYQRKMRMGSTGIVNHESTKHSKLALERLALIPKGKGKEVLPPEHLTKSIYSGTWCRLIEDDQAATITTRFDTPSSGRFTLPDQNRCITVREAARLQSFPDSFVFFGSKCAQMKQVGNAVPPVLANAIAKEILKAEGTVK